MGHVDNTKVDRIIPLKEQRRLRVKRIKALYASGYSMDEVCKVLGVSKTTVFFAVKRRKAKVKQK